MSNVPYANSANAVVAASIKDFVKAAEAASAKGLTRYTFDGRWGPVLKKLTTIADLPNQFSAFYSSFVASGKMQKYCDEMRSFAMGSDERTQPDAALLEIEKYLSDLTDL